MGRSVPHACCRWGGPPGLAQRRCMPCSVHSFCSTYSSTTLRSVCGSLVDLATPLIRPHICSRISRSHPHPAPITPLLPFKGIGLTAFDRVGTPKAFRRPKASHPPPFGPSPGRSKTQCMFTSPGTTLGADLQELRMAMDPHWRWCSACDRPKPPLAHHCSICDKCVLKMVREGARRNGGLPADDLPCWGMEGQTREGTAMLRGEAKGRQPPERPIHRPRESLSLAPAHKSNIPILAGSSLCLDEQLRWIS